MRTYRTKSGDTWDKIAYEQLGSEYLLPFLLNENQEFRNYVEFPAGIELKIPDLEFTLEEMPEWLEEEDVTEEESVVEESQESEQPWRMEDVLD